MPILSPSPAVSIQVIVVWIFLSPLVDEHSDQLLEDVEVEIEEQDGLCWNCSVPDSHSKAGLMTDMHAS